MATERIQRRIDQLLDEADEAVSRSDWHLVRDRVQNVLALDPDNRDALSFLAAADRAFESSVSTPDGSASQSPSTPAPPSTAQERLPTSFANGRYQVKKLLGEGGRKRVYQAHDTVLDRDVALAVIKTEGLDPTSRVRITREAQAMGRLGDHPHILSIHDLGDEAGQPYLILPLMSGGDVGTLLEAAENHRLPLEQAIDLAMQVCRGLEFAHSKGIVHRDLKPGNVWITEDGTARIGDFGLAVAVDRSRLTQEGMMVGTVSYMPPEQAMGGEVTPQSDLYSLGAVLYEMVTGRPPFLGDDSVAIIGQHINTPPVAPTWHNPQCPRALEALIMRLLAKDTGERPNSATDAITALEGVDLTLSAHEPAPEREEAHALDSLAGGVFVGRQREMGELKAALEDALSGRGRMMTLVGEPGIGKTRTAEELATYARMRGAQVLSGRCYEEQGVPPYWPWVQAIRGYVRASEPEQLKSEMGAGAADIAEIISDVKSRLPDLEPPPRMDSPEQARFRLFDSVAAFIRTASQKQPMVLLLDDLHWSDTPSLMLLLFVARELSGSRLLLLGTYRDVELSRQHPLAETLAELTRERLFNRVLLRGLSERDVARFIEIASGIRPSQTLTQAVHSQTEGNPLFVTEVVRLLVQEGELTLEQVRGRESWEIGVPEGVREVIGRRLNQLSQRCNDVLTIASVVGREFTLELLNRLTDDLTQDMLLDVLDQGLRARVIEELPDAAGRYQFTHGLVQETLSGELTLTRRVRVHARIAEALEELWADNLEARSAELAHHFVQAETVLGIEKIVKYSVVAGERALTAHANEEALQHFTRAFSAMDHRQIDATLASVLYGLGRAQAVTSETARAEDAVANLRAAFGYYKETADVSRAALIAQLPHSTEVMTGLADVISQGLSLVPSDSVAYGRILANHGYVLGTSNDYPAAEEAFERAMAIAKRHLDRPLEARVLANSGNIDGFHLRLDTCLEKCLSALKLLEGNEHSSTRLRARLWAAQALIAIGRPEEAREHCEDLGLVADRLRDRIWINRSALVNKILAHATGDWKAVYEATEAAVWTSSNDIGAISFAAFADWQQGRDEQLQQHLDQLGAARWDAGATFMSWTRETIALSTVSMIRDAGREEALTAFLNERLGRAAVPHWEIPIHFQNWTAALAMVAIRSGDREGAREQFDSLLPFRGMLPLNAVCAGRILGMLAHTMHDFAAAADHFEESLAFCRKAGYRPELAWTCCDYADMLLERDAEGDREKAVALLDESLAVSSDLGMRPLIERVLARKMSLQGGDVSSPQTSIDAVVSSVEAERRSLVEKAAAASEGAEPTRSSKYPGGLTQREVEVLRLIAVGRSNREIAEELVISLNTVIHHIRNIFAKIGSANRAEAATYAAQHELLV